MRLSGYEEFHNRIDFRWPPRVAVSLNPQETLERGPIAQLPCCLTLVTVELAFTVTLLMSRN